MVNLKKESTENKKERTITLKKGDIDRLSTLISPPELNDNEGKRLKLKKLSEERAAKWPDNVEAIRKKKVNNIHILGKLL